jgi:hypothetical protein
MTMLFASSNTEEGITQCVVKFYGGQPMRIDGENVIRVSDNKTLDSVRIVKKKGRYRFERKETP